MERLSGRQPWLLAIVAIGVATILSFPILSRLVSPGHLVIYHISGDPSALFLPAIADVLLLAAICFVLLRAFREGTRLHRALWSLILCFLPWILAKSLTAMFAITFFRWSGLSALAVSGLLSLVLTFSSSPFVVSCFNSLRRFSQAILASVGIVGILALVQTAWYAIRAHNMNNQTVGDTIRKPSRVASHRRVVWIVLDELAYEQLYGNRLPGLNLPAFDQFRSESTLFNNVVPAGIKTEIVLPALMTGHSVNRIHSSTNGLLLMHDERGWQSFDQRDTVFADADRLGYRTAVVGWYNPYCRILPAVLDSCFWVNRADFESTFPENHILPNLLYPLLQTVAKAAMFLDPHNTGPRITAFTERGQHIRDFLQLDHAADAALSDSRNTFVFLHMPVPHPNGIWNRTTSQFADDDTSYVDNLALADAWLAHVRALLQQRGEWDSTTVVIMGDHAWRTQMIWMRAPVWSAEDEAASEGGKFDPRPAYLVKLPQQHTPALINTTFAATRTRPLLDQLLRGGITEPAELQQWAVGQPVMIEAHARTPGTNQPTSIY